MRLSPRHINKVHRVSLSKDAPLHASRYRWITRRNSETGRYYGRAPRIGTRIRDLDARRDSDYGPERILPKDAYVVS
jgi:hypothetical protein